MQYALPLLALAASVVAIPQGVTSEISAGAAPAGCDTTHSGSFTITVMNVTSTKKRSVQERQTSGILTLTLDGSVLKDQAGRTGYIASNFQFQFDNPPQNGAIFTSGFSLCSNGSLAHGGSATWFQCKSGDFFNLYDRDWAPQCNAVFIDALLGSGTATEAAGQNPDGQATATTAVSQISDGQPAVTQITDGQPQAATGAPVSQLSDGQPQGPASAPAVSQISDGQPQATGAVSQISDGQPQASGAVSQISDGQPQASGAVSQISDGQPQAPTGAPITQISDGQPQAPTGAPVTQISDGQPQAGNATFSASPSAFTGAAAPARVGQEVLGVAVGILGAVALL